MADSTKIVKCAQGFLSNTLHCTEYNEDLQAEAETVYANLKQQVAACAGTADGKKMIQKYHVLASTVSTEGTFVDMVKIMWRMVKTIPGSGQHKLVLFILGICTVASSLETTRGPHVASWVTKIHQWLGKQLTIGGKGVAGDGEGDVTDRIQRFFSTPYLHDFD